MSCYRLYDADLPEYAVAIDRYEQWLHVQEYAPPASVDPARAQERLQQVMAVLPAVLAVPPDQVFLKIRQRQKGASQYQKQAEQGRFHEIQEGPARLRVNGAITIRFGNNKSPTGKGSNRVVMRRVLLNSS